MFVLILLAVTSVRISCVRSFQFSIAKRIVCRDLYQMRHDSHDILYLFA